MGPWLGVRLHPGRESVEELVGGKYKVMVAQTQVTGNLTRIVVFIDRPSLETDRVRIHGFALGFQERCTQTGVVTRRQHDRCRIGAVQTPRDATFQFGKYAVLCITDTGILGQ